MPILSEDTAVTGNQPNILLIQVDAMRFPMGLPSGVRDAGEFLRRFLPNLWSLWCDGVKFSRYYTAASDCSPARAALVTGLYAQQTSVLLTRAAASHPAALGPPQPGLDPRFPTYGKLLREAGYDTPWIGKWHLSDCPDPRTAGPEERAHYLDAYGFEGLTLPDPLGLPGQGVGEVDYGSGHTRVHAWDDAEIAAQALAWLRQRERVGNPRPFCLTLGFVNPHDQQFFWGGTEAQRFREAYRGIGEAAPFDYGVTPSLGEPPHLGYGLPANWQSEAALAEAVAAGRLPKMHLVSRRVRDHYAGAIADGEDTTTFGTRPTPVAAGAFDAVAPFRYWTRALDLYTFAMTEVDRHIGTLMDNLPAVLKQDLVVVFTSDHGDYAGAHGLRGQGGTVYDECYRVPLLVRDFSARFTADPDRVREQLFASVDLLPMLVSMGHRGSGEWLALDPELNQLYGRRGDLLACLRDCRAPGRDQVVFTSDEHLLDRHNFLDANTHIVGAVDGRGKLGAYCRWRSEAPGSHDEAGAELVYFDYGADPERRETDSTPDSPEAQRALRVLFDELIPDELLAPVPPSLEDAARQARDALMRYLAEARSASTFAGLAPLADDVPRPSPAPSA